MNIDHKVAFRSQQAILYRVMRERQIRGIDHLCCYNTRRVIETFLNLEKNDKSKPKLVLFVENIEPHFNFKQFTINANRVLWEEAGFGDPLANFKLLHEIAHSLFHKHPFSSFSSAKHSQMAYAQDEYSAEWQANVFACFFFAPPYLAFECKDRKTFSERFHFPSEFIDFWFYLNKRRSLEFACEFCSRCGSETLVRIGHRLKCLNCQHTL